ncbi:MAG: thioredoxin family protein [Bacilli bacterium]|nr:thioredoxin family protein [Bacilli bacterium]
MKKELLVISAVWCPSCLILNKNLKRIKEEYKNIAITKLDYDFDEEEVMKYNVGKTLPVMILKKDNQEINRLIGEKTYEEITMFLGSDE